MLTIKLISACVTSCQYIHTCVCKSGCILHPLYYQWLLPRPPVSLVDRQGWDWLVARAHGRTDEADEDRRRQTKARRDCKHAYNCNTASGSSTCIHSPTHVDNDLTVQLRMISSSHPTLITCCILNQQHCHTILLHLHSFAAAIW